MGKEIKLKQTSKNGITRVVIKNAKGQTLSQREVFSINNHEVPGLLPMEVEQRGKNFKLEYDMTGLMSLDDYLLTPMNREGFACILQNVLEVFHQLQKLFMNEKGLLLETDKVYVNPAKRQLMFIYLPIQHYEAKIALRTFLLQIIQVGSFAQGEDINYVQEYIRIINEGLNFSIFELEEYVKGLISGDGYQQKSRVCLQCNSTIESNYKFCPICGAKLMDSEEDMEQGINKTYDPRAAVLSGELGNKSVAGNGNLPGANTARHGLGTEGLYVPGEVGHDMEEEGGTTVLGSLPVKAAYLLRFRTEERIPITKDEFVLGKSASCDYTVSDNSAVSRQHALLTKHGEKYYLKDLGSTNKTYLNEEVIGEEEIESGMNFRLGNEQFCFYYD